ncbi:hypothetical protein KEM56_000550 [Ascosphaera pollenicola]|nr:hypothetical protein KEM56_000550 [Ascosphaera pollenicola]
MSISPLKSPKKTRKNGKPRLKSHTCYTVFATSQELGDCEVCQINAELDAALQEDIQAQLDGYYMEEWKGIEDGVGNVEEVAKAADKLGPLGHGYEVDTSSIFKLVMKVMK